jgi:hypothetical protein
VVNWLNTHYLPVTNRYYLSGFCELGGKEKAAGGKWNLSLLLLFEEGLQNFGGGNGVKTLFFLAPRELGGSQFILGAKTAKSLILEVYGNVKMFF